MAKRSHEPIFWSLFGAGGVIAALVLPVLVAITGILWPLGLMPAEALSYERMRGFAESLFGPPVLFAVISFTLWHAAHRIFHSLHDLGVHRGLGVWKLVCYGAAFLGTAWVSVTLATLQF
jgi:fumarate reductase subunit D